jgi:hypothetical protein
MRPDPISTSTAKNACNYAPANCAYDVRRAKVALSWSLTSHNRGRVRVYFEEFLNFEDIFTTGGGANGRRPLRVTCAENACTNAQARVHFKCVQCALNGHHDDHTSAVPLPQVPRPCLSIVTHLFCTSGCDEHVRCRMYNLRRRRPITDGFIRLRARRCVLYMCRLFCRLCICAIRQ